MAKLDPTQFAEKWGRRLKGSTTDIQAGINRVTVAPGQAAAAQAQIMLANLTARVNDGTWAKRVAGVGLDDWKRAALNKGVQRIGAGVDGAMDKTRAMAEKLLPAIDAAVAAANRTPRGDLNVNIQRAVTFMTEMSKRAPTRQK